MEKKSKTFFDFLSDGFRSEFPNVAFYYCNAYVPLVYFVYFFA
jgi:hypothetical protein